MMNREFLAFAFTLGCLALTVVCVAITAWVLVTA